MKREWSKFKRIEAHKKSVGRKKLAAAKASSYTEQIAGMGGSLVYTLPKTRGKGRPKMLYGITLSSGKVYNNPSHHIANAINSALTKPPRMSVATVYDANGKAIATIDPHTRQRKPI